MEATLIPAISLAFAIFVTGVIIGDEIRRRAYQRILVIHAEHIEKLKAALRDAALECNGYKKMAFVLRDTTYRNNVAIAALTATLKEYEENSEGEERKPCKMLS